MKKLFYASVVGLMLFEIANVYFIMPMPGSQQINSIELAYQLYSGRWIIRGLFLLGILVSFQKAWFASRVFTVLALLVVGGIAYLANFKMAADAMFLQPTQVTMAPAAANIVKPERLVLGVTVGNQARAYPIQYLGYHHQVLDAIHNKPIMVTYCTVCRTGRVFEPTVNGKPEQFRLVGMDHFNAMFEDKTTRSWWRQATGEAIAGRLKGQTLPEVNSAQVSLSEWLKLYPQSLIMQPDKAFVAEYDSLSNYETGRRKGSLTRRDTLSWQPKSWVVGVTLGPASKAYDWNTLMKERIIYDELNQQPIVVILAQDNQSFTALQRTGKNQKFTLTQNTLTDALNQYNLLGTALNPVVPALPKLAAYQEYWHSWQTFHPKTQKY
ncbi:DUF3179 domain-containing (seleno)protein [Adhaeribacter pallidiroseus]|uniref:DUF3179 domain-containing protein n=1 Tax=Adhaeribacter pallidiroseus TaxID=2072847 RepID=A0A369QGU8_9BACT|nr:DUF3179 domain-containing (seleno)protein [Adhaeribacter pallidiroseus]RDC63652.1 hypothetical protein AHMF7616_02257 [Adhaeribacter pallidiroseus]